MPKDLDYDMTPENVAGYLKSKGYSDDLAQRLSVNVMNNPFGGANYSHIAGTRKWIDSQLPSPNLHQVNATDMALQGALDAQQRGTEESKLSGTPTGEVLYGMSHFRWVQSQQKAQQAAAQAALKMINNHGADPQVALNTAQLLYTPLHQDTYLGVVQKGMQAGMQSQGAPADDLEGDGYAQHSPVQASNDVVQPAGAVGSMFQGK